MPRPAATPGLRRAALGAGAVVVAAIVVVGGLKAHSLWHQFSSGSDVSNGGGRITSVGSNFRATWWEQAWHAFTVHPLAGTGGGTFTLTNLLYRDSYLDRATEFFDAPGAGSGLSTDVVEAQVLRREAEPLIRGK